MFTDFYANRVIPIGINSTFILLLSKVKGNFSNNGFQTNKSDDELI